MTLHVIFTPEGIPAHISDTPRAGSEPVEVRDEWGDPIAFLAGHRRAAKGKWVPRDPVVPLPPTADELAARAEAEYRATLAARDEALRAALASEADPMFFRWQRDECSREDWLVKVAEVKARFPKPGSV